MIIYFPLNLLTLKPFHSLYTYSVSIYWGVVVDISRFFFCGLCPFLCPRAWKQDRRLMLLPILLFHIRLNLSRQSISKALFPQTYQMHY